MDSLKWFKFRFMEVFTAHGKGSFDSENEHAPPANRGPSGKEAGGGKRGELLHLIEVSLFLSLWDKDQKRPMEIKAESMRRLKKGHTDYCVCQLEVIEQRTGGRIKEV